MSCQRLALEWQQAPCRQAAQRVVYYAEEVVRESSGEDSPTAEFWEMVEV